MINTTGSTAFVPTSASISELAIAFWSDPLGFSASSWGVAQLIIFAASLTILTVCSFIGVRSILRLRRPSSEAPRIALTAFTLALVALVLPLLMYKGSKRWNTPADPHALSRTVSEANGSRALPVDKPKP